MIFREVLPKKSFWYLDTTDTTDVGNTGYEARRLLTRSLTADGNGPPSHTNIIIPINRYSFFEELEDKMLVPMQLQFNITLNEDNEFIHTANGVEAGRIVIDKFELWLPKLIPRDSMASKYQLQQQPVVIFRFQHPLIM